MSTTGISLKVSESATPISDDHLLSRPSRGVGDIEVPTDYHHFASNMPQLECESSMMGKGDFDTSSLDSVDLETEQEEDEDDPDANNNASLNQPSNTLLLSNDLLMDDAQDDETNIDLSTAESLKDVSVNRLTLDTCNINKLNYPTINRLSNYNNNNSNNNNSSTANDSRKTPHRPGLLSIGSPKFVKAAKSSQLDILSPSSSEEIPICLENATVGKADDSKKGILRLRQKSLAPDSEFTNDTSALHSLRPRKNSTAFDDLLFEIYDRWHYGCRDSFDSDTYTDLTESEAIQGRSDGRDPGGYGATYYDLETDAVATRLNAVLLQTKGRPTVVSIECLIFQRIDITDDVTST